MNAPEKITVAAGQRIEMIALNAIAPSNTHIQQERRKRFNKDGLKELAESIKTTGGVFQPVVVRPHPKPTSLVKYELVAGERRWIATGQVPFDAIPAIVMELDDGQVLEFQLIENLQREDVHEMEEAEGYSELMRLKGLKAEDIAPRVGKSRRYVYNRLKLLQLCPEGRKAFYDGKVSASVAFYIARIGHHDTQREALKTMTGRGGDPMPARQALDIIERSYMLELKDAPFDLKKLYFLKGSAKPVGVACGECPKRTGNQKELFADVKNGDVCTDPKCFSEKRQAAAAERLAEAEAKGKKVITGKEAEKIFPPYYTAGSTGEGFTTADESTYKFGANATWRKLLGTLLPEPMLVQEPSTGDVIEVYQVKALEAAAQKAGFKKATSTTRGSSSGDREREKKAKLETQIRARVLHELREKKRGKVFGREDLVLVATEFYDALDFDERKRVVAMWTPPAADGKRGDVDELRADKIHTALERFKKRIPGMVNDDVSLLLVDLALVGYVQVGTYSSDKAEPLFTAAARAKVDVAGIRKELGAAAKPKKAAKVKKAAPAKKATKKKAMKK